VEIDERSFMKVGHTKASVISVLWVGSAVPVKEQIVRSETVVVRTLGCGSYGERHLREHSGFEYPLGPHERYTLILKYKSLSEHWARQDIAMDADLLRQPTESCKSNYSVQICHGEFLIE
jgi:hypothetical protein